MRMKGSAYIKTSLDPRHSANTGSGPRSPSPDLPPHGMSPHGVQFDQPRYTMFHRATNTFLALRSIIPGRLMSFDMQPVLVASTT